jgi:hypothetical protein
MRASPRRSPAKRAARLALVAVPRHPRAAGIPVSPLMHLRNAVSPLAPLL